MSLMQKAYQTYDAVESAYAGLAMEGFREPLAPVSHAVAKAGIEITIDGDGKFVKAVGLGKFGEKTVIPVTEDSAGRTSAPCAHPLCDYIQYFDSENEEKFKLYMEQLDSWLSSPYSHPMLMPIYNYVAGRTIVNDLIKAGVVDVCEDGMSIKDEKIIVRWRVLGIGPESGGCWESRSLQEKFRRYYASLIKDREPVICSITGEEAVPAKQHPKGIAPINGNAKLISSNDKSGFTYLGRFLDAAEAVSIGYEASQKIHNVLKWLITNQGTVMDGRTFLSWNPEMIPLPDLFDTEEGRDDEEKPLSFPEYRKALKESLCGGHMDLLEKEAIIAVFDAATKGRLSVSYYNETAISALAENLFYWKEGCCWTNGKNGVQSPSIFSIINYSYGVLRNGKMTVDDGLKKNLTTRLLACRTERRPIPLDIVRSIISKCGNLQIYKRDTEWVRYPLLWIACSVIRKYYIDAFQEEYPMELEPDKKDRSYQYGRLLAAFEKLEKDTYEEGQERETNALRLQSMFVKRPLQTAAAISEKLNIAYMKKLSKGSRIYYETLIQEIFSNISGLPDGDKDTPLSGTYILGYNLQKNEFYKKNKQPANNV